ncbi:hypothetical protein TI05_01330 [Achromatium sp. WMS3]|nr:hypothetical protein TI05_01330 [Achromatium sp. WMS3]
MIQDDELRQLFRIESEEHLQKLEQHLLQLESQGTNQELLAKLQREAHSLKGSARMLGIVDIETVTHAMEDVFKALSNAELILTPEWVDRLEEGLDTLQKMAHEAITGTPARISAQEAIAKLAFETSEEQLIPKTVAAIPDSNTSESAPAITMQTAETNKLEESQSDTTQADKTQIDKSQQIDVIRVEPKKLDVLLTRVGELTVTKTHIESWLTQMEGLIASWEEVVRTVKKIQGNEELSEQITRIGNTLYPLRQAAFEDSTALNRITDGLESDIRALRLLPLDRVFQLFPRTVRDLARTLSKQVQLNIQGGDTTADKQLIEMLKAPLMHLLRNAIYHGIETPEERQNLGKPAKGNIQLQAKRTAAHILIQVKDDGRGLDEEAIKQKALEHKLCTQEELSLMSRQRLFSLIFNQGFSTAQMVTDISGRGVGLDVVRSSVEQLKGTISVDSIYQQGCTFQISLPLTLATTRILFIRVAERHYAIPVEFVRMVRYIALNTVFLVQDRETISLDGQAISVAWLDDLLELPKKRLQDEKVEKQPYLLLEMNEERLGIFVDEILEELEVVLKPTGPLLSRVRNVSGITILGSGEICVVLNPLDLMRSAQKHAHSTISRTKLPLQDSIGNKSKPKKVVLLAEDSITTRTQEKRILEGAGYDVITAVDGLAAFNTLATCSVDAIVSDIEMPRMDGLTLASKVRKNKDYEHLPVILISSLAKARDRKRGMDAGANAYIPKSAFNQQTLLDTLRRLV